MHEEFMNDEQMGDIGSTQRFNDDFLAPEEPGLNSEERSAIEALPSGSALLIVQRGPNEGSRFLLDQEVTTVGRHPNADIFLDDVTVSRRHAEFRRTGAKFTVTDLASLNGTYFDGVRIDNALLDEGAEVQIGKYKFTFFASRSDLEG
ncbi:MAG: FHA domain-containing protein [Rhodoluna sp.]